MGGRPFDFSDVVKWETLLRQKYRCGACGADLRNIPDNAHHVVPNQCGDPSNASHDWLREVINCVWLCFECHEEVHDDANYRTGNVAMPSFYKYSHAGDIEAHKKWVRQVSYRARKIWFDFDTDPAVKKP